MNIIRVQRKRIRGWRMPENTVYVGRPTVWSNPWTIEAALESKLFHADKVHKVVTDEYKHWLLDFKSPNDEHLGFWLKPMMIEKRVEILNRISELRGKNLACWCPADKPCHADVLIMIANPELWSACDALREV